MLISKNKIKLIRSLASKKNRTEHGMFVAEGPKLVESLLGSFHCRYLVGTRNWLERNLDISADEIIETDIEDIEKASLLKTPQDVIAVFDIRDESTDFGVLQHYLCLALDDIQDPGNLGTIVRIADWFGIEHIFCSLGTADIYNPKTVQATMGALARVHLHYLPLTELRPYLKGIHVYGTFLDGDVIYNHQLSDNGLIIMGNEGNGISKVVEQMVDKKLFIPNYPQGRATSESLNVAVATAIVCAEFRRRRRR